MQTTESKSLGNGNKNHTSLLPHKEYINCNTCAIEEDGDDDDQLPSTVNTTNHVAMIHKMLPTLVIEMPM